MATEIKSDVEKYAKRTFMKYSTADIGKDAEGETRLLSCNEAIARGAIEAGVRVAASYPGSPVNYVIDNLVNAAALYPSMHVEWSANEKCAFEVALGASLANLRSLCILKQVGFNWVVDPLVNCVVRGPHGLVLVVADDPGAETTSGEQDSRYLTKFVEMPLLEPATMQEVKDFTALAFDLSDELRVPVMVRILERMAYGRGPVVLGKILHRLRERKAHISNEDPWSVGGKFPRLTDMGMSLIYGHTNLCHMRFYGEANRELEDMVGKLPKLSEMIKAIERFPHNKLILRDKTKVGVIACAEAYNQTMEALKILGMSEEVSILKLATTYPLPETLLKELLAKMEVVLVVEEIRPFVEEQVRSIAADLEKHARILGKLTRDIPISGELDRNTLGRTLGRILGKGFKPKSSPERIKIAQDILGELNILEAARSCPGCPEHAGLFALKMKAKELGIDIIGVNDDGCHSLSSQPPLEIETVSVTMGAAIGSALGIAHSGVKDKKVVAFMGDSTFFHAGLPELVNAVYNKTNLLIVILDNKSTAMTGHQPHPGAFGITATGEPTKLIDIAEICRAFQVDYVGVADPYDYKQTRAVFEEALKAKGVAVVVVRRTCALVAIRGKSEG